MTRLDLLLLSPALCLAIALVACEGAEPVDPEPIATGAIRVSVSVTGIGIDRDGIIVSINGAQPSRVETPGSVLLSNVPVGDRAVVASDYSPNCRSVSVTSVVVTVDPDATEEVHFALDCVPTAYVGHHSFVSVVTTIQLEAIPTGGFNKEIALTPDGQELYVLLSDINVVEIIDVDQRAVVRRIPIEDPADVAFSADGTLAYVPSGQPRSISLIDVGSASVVDVFSVAGNPNGVVVTSSGIVFVTSLAGEVSVIDADGTVETVFRGDGAWDVEISADDSSVWLSNGFGDTVRMIDTSTREIVAEIPVDMPGFDIALTPGGRDVFLANTNDDFLTVIDAEGAEVEQTIPVPVPSHIAVTPDGSLLYITRSSARCTWPTSSHERSSIPSP